MDFFAIFKVFKVDKVSSLNSRVTRPGIMHHSLVQGLLEFRGNGKNLLRCYSFGAQTQSGYKCFGLRWKRLSAVIGASPIKNLTVIQRENDRSRKNIKYCFSAKRFIDALPTDLTISIAVRFCYLNQYANKKFSKLYSAPSLKFNIFGALQN